MFKKSRSHRSTMGRLILLQVCLAPLLCTGQSYMELENVVFVPSPVDSGASDPRQEGNEYRDMYSQGDHEPLSGIQTKQLGATDSSANTLSTSLAHQDNAISTYRKSIEEQELEEGPYSPAVVEDLLSLGALYQQQNQHGKAIEAFARAEHINRVNHGLYSEKLINAVELTIESLTAMRRMQEADEKYHYLVHLYKNIYGNDDIRTIPALQKLADWKMLNFHRSLRGSADSGSILASGNIYGQEARTQAYGLLQEAQDAYLQAITILIDHKELTDSRLQELEKALVETYFIQAYQETIIDEPHNYSVNELQPFHSLSKRTKISSNSRSYSNGKKAYNRILTYLERNSSATREQYARAMIELGDWYMLFGHKTAGLKKYREAHGYLVSGGLPTKDIADIMHPSLPVPLPSFADAPFASAPPSSHYLEKPLFQGYIDLALTINKYGKAGRIKIIETSRGTPPEVESKLLRTVRQGLFRPSLEDGELVTRDDLSLRYYYSY